jgi:mono/diheme cytochrome c family protein
VAPVPLPRGREAPVAPAHFAGQIDTLDRARTFSTLLAAWLAGLAVVASAAAASDVPGATTVRFLRAGREVGRLDLAALRAALPVETVTIDDPYYERRKTFRAFPLRAVLALGFGDDGEPAAGESYFFRARDGYVKPAPPERVREPGGYLAFADADAAAGWEPIDRRQVDPGPYYLVWRGADQRDVHRYPWPYQLVAIELAAFASEYPHTAPTGAAPDAPAWAGFAIFRDDCIACHAVNGEGGRIGPDLNVPRSIVEYRPRAQIKAYIRDPASFRYTSMPAHPHLSDTQLDAIVSYFDVMRTLKRDPGHGP